MTKSSRLIPLEINNLWNFQTWNPISKMRNVPQLTKSNLIKIMKNFPTTNHKVIPIQSRNTSIDKTRSITPRQNYIYHIESYHINHMSHITSKTIQYRTTLWYTTQHHKKKCQSKHRSALPQIETGTHPRLLRPPGNPSNHIIPPNLPAGITPSAHTNFSYHNHNHMHHKSIPKFSWNEIRK